MRAGVSKSLTSSAQTTSGPNVLRLIRLFAAVRSGFGDLVAPQAEQELEIALAYVSQVLLHQRYCLERMHENAVTLAFDTVARYWVERFRRALANPRAGDETKPIATQVAQSEETHEATIGSLWALALHNPRTDIVEAHSQRFLASIEQKDPVLFNSPLTELQSDVFNRWPENRCFQSSEHVIIAGPTSCGKSKLAEMFLTGPPLWNKQRTCTLYIAPTRALAQAKHRELDCLLKASPELHARLVLSTGEDTDDDWRITHARFAIGCLVYEKANILFSQNRKLLNKLACVVIDEMHMLTDLERGPTLEICALKVLMERKRLDYEESRDPAREFLRVVAISTEDKPDAALRGLLSVHSSSAEDRRQPPTIFHGVERPVPVEHMLILPPGNGEQFTLEKIVEFSRAEQRKLTRSELQVIDRRLDQVWQSAPYQELLNSRKDPRKEMHSRLTDFLIQRLAERPRGYRALVFVPGRGEVENLAQRLRKRLIDQAKGGASILAHDELYHRLKAVADIVEDQRSAEIVRRCAAYGILIHHADVDRKIRAAIEEGASTLTATTPSEVIFATETLSYGVNLALNDVILLGTTFYCQSRAREPKSESLAACAFHNMAGRAGRLGKTDKSGAKTCVFVVVPFDEKPMAVVERYYTTIDPLTSQIYVEDDKQHQYRIEDNKFAALLGDPDDPCAKYRGLTALKFSYPYVRSVLDALRHLNTAASGVASTDARVPRRYEDLIEIFGNSLYAFQRLEGPASSREVTMFKCAVHRILDSCAEPPLELVKVEEGTQTLYTITTRGESIIDTGTELHTVEPMLRFASWLHQAWGIHGRGRSFPVELYLLSVVSQREVYRNYIRYAPECRTDEPGQSWNAQVADLNRAAVLRSLTESLSILGVDETASLANAVRQFLDDWEPLSQIPGAYSHAATDGVLRLFNGLIAWINGKERSIVEDLIEVVEGAEGLRTKLQGFKQFTDQVSWKILFLAKMLGTAKTTSVYGPDDERKLHMLVSRLRLGCTPEAIPLFWPHSSDFKRQQAVALLDAGMSPDRLVCMPTPQKVVTKSVKISPEKLDRLCRDLEKFAIKELTELAEEMTAVEAHDPRREAVHRLWRELAKVFPETIRQFRQISTGPLNVDGILRECLAAEAFGSQAEGGATLGPKGRTLDDRFRIRIEPPTSGHGIGFCAERSLRDPQAGEARTFVRQATLRLVFVQMRRDWFCKSGEGNWIDFAELLRQERATMNLVLVAAPWIPSIETVSESVIQELKLRQALRTGHTVFLSPAAFGTITSSIARDFTSGESFFRLILGVPARAAFVGVSTIQALLDSPGTQLPQSIREKLIRHFEVAPFGFERLTSEELATSV